MSYHDTLVEEINTKLDERMEQQLPLLANWVAHEICNAHASGLAQGEAADFWRHGGYEHTRDQVRRCINKRTEAITPREPQMSLPGFDRTHLQDYYLVRRGSDDIGVHVLALTDEEIDAKAAQFDAMGKACMEHADELRRFKGWRVQLVAAE